MMDKALAAYKTLGVIFICLLIVGVWLTYAIFTKKFADYEEIKLETTSVGLQLPSRADVKIRGVIVGEVLEADTGEQGAELKLGIYPDELDSIPANVTGAIVPKTLFGEKYVSLVIPESGPQGQMKAGTTITKTDMGTEVEEVLNDLYPLLEAVRPADLNATLSALATALEGRGSQLGENLETVDSYLKRINPEIPALLEDLRLTAQVSDLYADILPEVAQILDDTIVTTGTLEEKEATLNSALRDIRSFADTARGFLARNGGLIKEANDLTATQLDLLARYAPEFPCFFKGLTNIAPRIASMFRGFELHIVLEALPQQPRHYTVADRPKFGDFTGPRCYSLPNPPWSQENPFTNVPNFDDGVDEPTGKGTMRVAPGFDNPVGYRGTPEDVAMLRQLLRGTYGEGADSGLGVLLAGPIVAEAGDR
ncbi:MCE family protein [Nocardioides bizhenqiangii]|uniref:MCE family protein n=1 Tax=Nocardioides bizhenqiangii TaxID=3095076 RepID=A0ABZ0ZS37_9ACTN|nr:MULTISPECIES: MCE family protein [unclassified Nocardioides]MDZ5622803.1 MCE family protein [Nocardioides sp. HM23]WQQ27063.1 MCE family protein [Nocardioides sp. HM61]